MPSFKERTLVLSQARRDIVTRAVQRCLVEDETPIEGGHQVTHWDRDGADTVLATFGVAVDDGIETIVVRVVFEPASTQMRDVQGMSMDDGSPVGRWPVDFWAEDRALEDQKVLRQSVRVTRRHAKPRGDKPRL